MGLTDAVRRFATSRPHILLLAEPGGLLKRLETERHARLSGWPLTDGPADADLLVVAGGNGDFTPYVQRVWNQLPGPRACAVLRHGDDSTLVLEKARRQLADLVVQRVELQTPNREVEPASHAGHNMSGHSGHDMNADPTPDPSAHAGHDMSGHAGHDMSGHAGHDISADPTPDPSAHAGHDMSGMEMPFGLGMADRGVDRDGLKLDVLTVTWGPALPWWPAGLVVTTVLQGDVVTMARVERVGDPVAEWKAWRDLAGRFGQARVGAAARLDSLARLMAVAGWPAALLGAQRVRDELLTDGDPAQVSRWLHRLSRRVTESRSLAAMTSRIYTSSGSDIPSRYRGWLHDATAAIDHGTPPPVDSGGADAVFAELPALLVGTELASARLIIASLDLELTGVGAEVGACA